MSSSIVEDLISSFQNVTNPFTYEATKVDSLFKYIKTIDWSETWLIVLIIFHLTITTLILLTTRSSNFQIVLFFLLLGLCSSSERINELGFKYWRSFAMEQYFDHDGIFIGIVFSGPIILNCCLMLLLWLYEAYLMIIKVASAKKKAYVTSQQKKEKKDDKNEIKPGEKKHQ